MSDIANNESIEVSEKPVQENEDVKFPPFPDPTDNDFEDDIPEEERTYYKNKFKDLNTITSARLHCTACDRHLGCSARNESRMRPHPLLRTLVCHTCHTFYNSGEFEKGDDGSELYCRWCGQGGQVYCCSGCPHVFCAKCIRRNLGNPKIKEIEELDDWKCFKCNNECLWDLRAICWAVLRYCDLKNKITYETQDLALKESYQKHCVLDHSECCKNKIRKKESKRKELDSTPTTRKSSAAALISKIPPTIQVKKFASIKMEESIKTEKKAQKRPASPKHKSILMKNPIAISTKMPNQMSPMPKKIRIPNSPVINPVRFSNDRKTTHTYSNFPRIRPKPPQISMMFNGFNNTATYSNDNINLSLENLTQGLDMSAVAAIAGSSNDDDVVCTPDFPLEPLCEVTEDNGDDDVQCITPGPAFTPKPALPPPPLVARNNNTLPDLSPANIVQMTENDVTVNTITGGLKFRVDPQTLSSNKMYRLPDGRIFAINANPSMPGGYSATIVALTDNSGKVTSKGATFAAKLSAVSAQGTTPPPLKFVTRNQTSRSPNKRSTPKSTKVGKATDSSRTCDLNVPVEWYRYNLIDAIDALEYSLSRLHHLKKNATSMHLRTRTINEMRNLHKSLERSLTTSMTRFKDVRDNLNKEFKQYITKKKSNNVSDDDDDDDVEILHEDDNDDPIFIDENSLESNAHDNHEVDLTAVGSSDLNDSSERSSEKNDLSRNEAYTSITEHNDSNFMKFNCNMAAQILDKTQNDVQDHELLENQNICNPKQKSEEKDDSSENQNEQDIENLNKASIENLQLVCKELINNIVRKTASPPPVSSIKKTEVLDEDKILDESSTLSENDKKVQDADMSEEMIENLLKDDNAVDDDTQNIQPFNISDEIKDVISEKD